MLYKRILKLQKALEKNQALLVSARPNRFYLSNFSSSAGNVLVTADSAYLLIDFRYFEKAKQEVKHLNVILLSDFFGDITQLCKSHNITELFIETYSTNLFKYKSLSENLKDISVLDDNKFDDLLEQMRSIKGDSELRLIKTAQKITDSAFSHVLNIIKAGVTEREVMLELELFMRRQGSEGVAFDTIVVSGKNSSLPHGVPSCKPIQNGDFVTMDFGAVCGGYCSDMTRTVAVGNVSDEQVFVYNTVLNAQEQAIKAIKAGAVCKEIDKIARDIIDNAGFENCFGHGLGHSVGIEIHESPAFNTRCQMPLSVGTVITVEPGIYIENRFGVRIEDMVFVTENGCIDITESRKDLIILK